MRIRTTTLLLAILFGSFSTLHAQRLKADKDKESRVKSIELDYQTRTAGPMMFFDARKHSWFGLAVSSDIMAAIWNPAVRDVFEEFNASKIKEIKKAGYTPVRFTYLEGRPTLFVRKSDDKSASRLYIWPLGAGNRPMGRRPTYMGRASQCSDRTLSENIRVLTDPESQARGFLSELNCSRGEAIDFSYISLDTAGKVIFEKKIRATEEFRLHEGQLVVLNEDRAFYAIKHKGNQGRFAQYNGFYEINKDGATFHSLDIDGYVLRDYFLHVGKDGNIYARGLVSSKVAGDMIGAATIRFNIGSGSFDDIKVEAFDGEALAASIIEKKRIKPKDVERDAPAVEYILNQSHIDRNGNVYLFAQNRELKTKRVMQVSSGTEATIRHYIYRDIMVVKMAQDGSILFTEVIPSTNVYSNFTPTEGYSFAFHQDLLYIVHPAYNGDLASFDLESSKITLPNTLVTANSVMTVSTIDSKGTFNSRDVFDFARSEAIFDPGHVLYDGSNNALFVLARNAKKRRDLIQMKISFPKEGATTSVED